MFAHKELLFNRHIRRGILRFFILAKLSEGGIHGYEILTLVREKTKGKAKKVNAGEIYSILDGLESKGYAKSKWVSNGKSSRPKKMFSITRKGRAVIVAGKKYFMSVFREFQSSFPEVFGE